MAGGLNPDAAQPAPAGGRNPYAAQPAGGRNPYAALAAPSRRRILDTIRSAAGPVDARLLAAELGLHVTTVRAHLDQLAEAGLVEAAAGHEPRRGRPRLFYTATRNPDPRDQLIDALADELATDRAVAAGRAWGEDLLRSVPAEADRTAALVRVLDRLEFSPEPIESGLGLRTCPFRESARRNPSVVCAAHRGLVEHIVGGATLRPFVEPELCVVDLPAR
ncbi:helix-turn-helix domain-containing protein [Actinoplanes sp. TRM 88003]|uniref:Helix-turn-helix domain-containing protein n=1 Tax=Paractinoplanes aksuensis TaxID=2939490 RepID=A0ABT1DTD4_9ACTN|nr:helix-turn-helix domain-containing protein [Actinoplanes aksuensis]MCO8274115.1 helix-turn-helix domain-containing protein [Actinoplanes aksuensis]